MNPFNRHGVEKQRLNETLSGQERVLNEARTAREGAGSPERREISFKMLCIELRPDEKLSKRRKAARAILEAFVRITKSADASGKLRPGFMVAVDYNDPTYMSLASFTPELEDLEIAMMRTQLKLIALEHGVIIERAEELNADTMQIVDSAPGEGAEKPRGSRRVTGQYAAGKNVVVAEVAVRNSAKEISGLTSDQILSCAREMTLREMLLQQMRAAWTENPDVITKLLNISHKGRQWVELIGHTAAGIDLMIVDPQKKKQCLADPCLATPIIKTLMQEWAANPGKLEAHLARLPASIALTPEIISALARATPSGSDPTLIVLSDNQSEDESFPDSIAVRIISSR